MMDILEYESVSGWLSNFPDRPNTRKNYLLRLRQFVEWIKKDPDTLIYEAKIDPVATHNQMKRYYNVLIENGKSSKTASLTYNFLRSFYRWNDVILGKTPRGFKGRVEYESSHVMTPDEISQMVDACTTIRDKSLVVFLAQSGQRNGVLTALCHRDVKTGLENNEPLLIVEVPAVLRDSMGMNVNKLGETYRFAVGKQAIQYLKKMVDERERDGEPIDEGSWLFRSYSGRLSGSKIKNPVRVAKNERGMPLTTVSIRNIVHGAALRAGIQRKFSDKRYEIHPHIFRRYWNMRMQEAGLSEDLRELMLGHKLPYDGAYSRWYPDAIKREWTAKDVEKFLQIP